MCLYKVYTDVDLPSPTKVLIAYKVFNIRNKHIVPRYSLGGSTDRYPIFGGYKEYYKPNKWYKNRNCVPIISDCYELYESGYHSFKLLDAAVEAAQSYFTRRVYEVSIRNITTMGEQFGRECYVSQEIKINRRIK